MQVIKDITSIISTATGTINKTIKVADRIVTAADCYAQTLEYDAKLSLVESKAQLKQRADQLKIDLAELDF